jgi:peroxiredoxin
MIPTGTAAPEFTLPGSDPNQEDAAVSAYALQEALTDGPVLLNFYLFDFHPACTKHLCDLHGLSWFDLDSELTVFGISTDRSFSHREFAASQSLDIVLLSDSDGSVAEAYDVLYDEFRGHKRIAKRSVFLIDTEGTVRYAWSTDDPSQHPDWEAVKDASDTLD